MTKISQYIKESEELFEKEIMCYCDGSKVSNHSVSNPETIKSFLKSRQLDLIKLVKGMVPKEENFEIKRPIKIEDVKTTLLAANYNRMVGFNLCRSQFLKNLEDEK